jgi:hypothetical protein
MQPNIRKRLANNPITYGMYQLWMARSLAVASIVELDKRLVVMDLVYFYNSALVSGQLSICWKDLEYFILLHDLDQLFRRDRPTTLEDCVTKYKPLISLNQDGDGWRSSRYERRNLERLFCPLSRVLMGRSFTFRRLKRTPI